MLPSVAVSPTEPEPKYKPGPSGLVYGEIPYNPGWAFTNDAGKQDFAQFFDKEAYTAAWHTDYNAKVFTNPNKSYFTFPPELEARVEYVELEDGNGSISEGVEFDAILRDTYVEVSDVIPRWYGKGWKKRDKFQVNPAHAKMRAFVMSMPTKDQQPKGPAPARIRFFGWHRPYTPQPYPRPLTPVENVMGAVCYPWNLGGSKGLKEDKSEVINALHLYRLYLDDKNIRNEAAGLYQFEPCLNGGWRLDTYLAYMHKMGKDVMLCPKELVGGVQYPETCRQLAIRYGANKQVPAKLAKVYQERTNNYQGDFSRNHVKIGLGYVKKIQLGNEENRWWKGRADIKAQENLQGFLTPFEYAAQCAKCYAAIKEVDPDMEVVLGGLATTSPGYMLAMLFWCEVYNGGEKCFDAVAYHDYCNTKGGQRQGDTGGLPPEMANYRKNGKTILQALYEFNGAQLIPAYITETGYSIATVNKEQAVQAIGPWNRFEVQAIYNVRTGLESLRAGHAGMTTYQMYDDSAFVNAPPDAWLNWDVSNGIADRNNPEDVHKRRPATDYTLQMLKLLKGYVLTVPAAPGDKVYIDKFEKARSPDFYSILVPLNTDVRIRHTLPLPGVSSITVYRLAAGQEAAQEETFPINGSYTLEATIAPVFVKIG